MSSTKLPMLAVQKRRLVLTRTRQSTKTLKVANASKSTEDHFISLKHPPWHRTTVVLNWLMSLFQPNRNYSFMINDLEQTVWNSGKDVHIDEVSNPGRNFTLYCYSLSCQVSNNMPQFSQLPQDCANKDTQYAPEYDPRETPVGI